MLAPNSVLAPNYTNTALCLVTVRKAKHVLNECSTANASRTFMLTNQTKKANKTDFTMLFYYENGVNSRDLFF